MDNNLRRTIILDNYQNPFNKGLFDDKSYIYANTNNESCIDEVNLMAKIENDVFVDIRFDGEACAICTSSSSIMLKLVINKKTNDVINIYHNFINMIEGIDYDKNMLGDAIVYDDIKKQPSRKKCVLLPWMALKKILDKLCNQE